MKTLLPICMELIAAWERGLDGRTTLTLKVDFITATAVTEHITILNGPGPWHHGQYLG